ncbi:uncharacterized protein LOC122553566 isoform X1 [Chiloscyllium plagiosum]|uniref:uncharacterized protein LOC122553566 isoform X1 n=1 Tax=Chiloscyllium plagiosum TaxID=36176 RepID=UPI001CB8497D|nr:uncharacterized protein LOC122553566 isoform X1 [Chiloscyllium plagiosum]
MKNAIWLKSKTVDVEIEDMDLCWHPVPNTCPPGEQYGRPAEQSNHALAYMNTQSNLCCIPTSTGSQKLVPLDVYGRPNIDRWTTAYHEAYNTYHDPRDGITFNWKTEEERLQEKAGCIGCQHGPTTTIVPPLGTMEVCKGRITRSSEYARAVEELKCEDGTYNNLKAARDTFKKVPKDVYGKPDTYRWKTEYDSSYNINPDVSYN